MSWPKFSQHIIKINLPIYGVPVLCAAVNKMIVGAENMELIDFDIQQEPVSIHQPLARLLAGGRQILYWWVALNGTWSILFFNALRIICVVDQIMNPHTMYRTVENLNFWEFPLTINNDKWLVSWTINAAIIIWKLWPLKISCYAIRMSQL